MKLKMLGMVCLLGLLLACSTHTPTPAPVPVPPTPAPNVNPPASTVVVVTLAPNTATMNSGGTLQFTPTVIGSTNTAVTWYLCGGTITAGGLYTAPTVTTKTTYCVSAISVADTSKVATSFVTVKPLADTVSVAMSLTSGDGQVIGMPVVYSYTVTSSKGYLTSISTNCGDGTTQVQNLFNQPPSGTTLTIVGMQTVTSGVICYPTKVGTLAPSMTVTDTLGAVGKAVAVNTTLPVDPCATAVVFGYTLPSWITALNWTNPADVQYSGTSTKPVATPTGQTTLPSTYTLQNYGRQYCVLLTAGGGTPPYTFSGTNLPPGLAVSSVNSTMGLLSGVATTAGTYTGVQLTVTDSKGVVAQLAPRSMKVCVMGAVC